MKRLCLIIFVTLILKINVNARELTEFQKKNADAIYEVVAENWDEYGVLPSVCIGQAMQESTLGEHCPNYNLWGLDSGKLYYQTLEDGVYGYMKCINNPYFKSATFKTKWREQLWIIAENGYCQPKDGYYNDVEWIIENYDLVQYDRKMFNDRAEKRFLDEVARQKRIDECNNLVKKRQVLYAFECYVSRDRK